MSKCGCYISGYPVDMIFYCPLHAAAPELLKACKAVKLWYEGDHEDQEKIKPDGELQKMFDSAIELIFSAIDEAEEEGNG